jgi:hypothetical protein
MTSTIPTGGQTIRERAMIKQAVATSVLLFGLSGVAGAENLPSPSADYRSKARMGGGVTVEYRHSNGKMRMEMRSAEMPQPMVAYFDVKTQKGVMIMSMPGMAPMAIEANMQEQGGGAVADGTGQRVGTDKVAGESCDLWKPDLKTADDKKTDAILCITRDGIMLRMSGNVNGKRETIFEVTELQRGPQDMKQLVPPPGLKPVKMPAGMTPPRK